MGMPAPKKNRPDFWRQKRSNAGDGRRRRDRDGGKR